MPLKKPILDAFPYPWPDRDAQALHNLLVSTLPKAELAITVATNADLDTSMVLTSQPVYFLWRDLLDAGALATSNRKLVQEALKLIPKSSASRASFERYLADKPTVTDEKPRSPDAPPDFLSGDDTVST